MLSSQPLHALAEYKPALFSSTSPPVVMAVRPHLEAAWPVILEGLTATMSVEALEAVEECEGAKLSNANRLLWACLLGVQQSVAALAEPRQPPHTQQPSGLTMPPDERLRVSLQCLLRLAPSLPGRQGRGKGEEGRKQMQEGEGDEKREREKWEGEGEGTRGGRAIERRGRGKER